MAQRKFSKINLILLSILLIATFFRLFRISDYMEFLGDQGRDLVIVRDFLVHGNLFFIGPQTSIGNMYLGPFYYYLFVAPGLLLSWFHPVGPSIVVALLGVLTVYLIFRFTKKWFGLQAAYISSFLYAISPVTIKYSNFSWNPNIMPLFALLFFYFCLESNYIFAAIVFSICLNSHYLALLLLPLGFMIWIKNYRSSSNRMNQLRGLIFAILIFLISLAPQVLFDVKHQGQNIKALTTFFTQRQTTVNLKPYKALPQIAPLFNQVNTRLVAGKNPAFGIILSLFFIVLIIWQTFIQYKQKKLDRTYVYLILWYLIGLIGLALYKQHIYDHYFGFLFPVVFILLGYLLTRTPRLFTLLAVLAITFFSLIENPFRWPAPKQLETSSLIVDQINRASKGKPFNFALLAKQNYDPPYRYLAAIKSIPMVDLHLKMTDLLYVVCEPNKDIICDPINNPAWDIAAFGWAKIDNQWQTNGIKVFQLSHNPQGLPPQ